MELDYRAIGKRIKADWTQEKLAEKVGISPTHMSNIETGTTRVSLTTIVNISNALGVTPDALLCDSVVSATAQIEQDIAAVLDDCDPYELRMIRDMSAALKSTLRKGAHLRENSN